MYHELDDFEPVAKIAVLGVGGAGNNAVNRMIDENITNVEFYVANTDKQALSLSKTPNRIILGQNTANGLGAGGDPKIGRRAAEESIDIIKEIILGKDMLFIAAGMGGGTGTGAAPVIAKAAKEMGILTVAIITRPFMFEGSEKSKIAVEGIAELSKVVDSVIVVSNDKLMMYEGNSTVNNAFAKADTILARSVKTVTDIIMTPYLMNLDFADVKNVLKDSVVALIGYGQGTGPNKANDAAESAINCPLLETGILGARRCLCGLTYGPNVTMMEINSTIQKINQLSGNQLNIKFALTCNNELDDDILISIIATDFVNAQEILSGESTNVVTKPTIDSSDEEVAVEEYENPDEIIKDFLKDEDINLFNL